MTLQPAEELLHTRVEATAEAQPIEQLAERPVLHCVRHLLGDGLVIRDLLFKGKVRYGDFLEAEEGISTNILADRLRTLQDHGLIDKQTDPEHGSKFIYSVTEKGRDLEPMLTEMILWSAAYDPDTAASPDFVAAAKREREAGGEVVLYARDLERMAAFYEGCVGLAPGESGKGYRGLNSAEWTLWLVAGDGAGGGADDGPPPRRSQTPFKLAFEVPSIEDAAARAAELGGSVDGRRRRFGGLDRRDAVDPEGNVIQLVEPSG